MNQTDVTKEGLQHVRPGREAMTGVHIGPGSPQLPSTARSIHRQVEPPMVPDAEVRSYYGKPVINKPVWESPDIPGYLFLGGLAGAGAVVGAAAQATGRPGLARVSKLGAAAGAGLSVAALVHDLGRPGRFLNMLRTFKVTSPMSVGSWVLSAFGPAAALAAASDLTGIAPRIGVAATAGAAALGPALATYTAALVANTAVPAWHEGHRELPFVFAASALSSAAGLGMAAAPMEECGPVRLLGAACGAAELLGERTMRQRMGLPKEAFKTKKAARYHRMAQAAILAGVGGSIAGGRGRLVSAVGGMGLLVGSALTRFSIFEAGMASAEDPRYTVVPQRERLKRSNPPS